MARGLSDLQKLILRLALDNRRQQELLPQEHYSADVRYAEVLVVYFGFPVTGIYITSKGTDLERANSSAGCQKFSKEKIGKERYAAEQAALSRAFSRLQQRGLVTWVCGAIARWSGGKLTEAGRAAAETDHQPLSDDRRVTDIHNT